MIYRIVCEKCQHEEMVEESDFQTMDNQGWRCWATPIGKNIACGSDQWAYEKIPQNADDIKVLRAEYNERHKNDPGFVPSVEYVTGPDGKNRPRES